MAGGIYAVEQKSVEASALLWLLAGVFWSATIAAIIWAAEKAGM